MAALGILTLDNEEYKVLEFNYKTNQQTDKLGRPVGVPKGSLFNLTIESDKGSSLMSWMLGNDAKDGVVTFYRHDAMQKFKEFAFKKSHCISWTEKFEANGNLPMRQTLRISEPYHEPKEEVIAAPKKIVQEEKVKKITNISWKCADMKEEINNADIGDKVSLWVETINYQEGETVTILVDEVDGKELKADVKEITFSGKVNADGIAELLREVEI